MCYLCSLFGQACEAYQEVAYLRTVDGICAKSMHLFLCSSLEVRKLRQLGKAHPKQCFFLWLILQQPELNHRFFAGYKTEDLIGRIAIVGSAGNNESCEYIALKDFVWGLQLWFSIFWRFILSHSPGDFFDGHNCWRQKCHAELGVRSLPKTVIEPCALRNPKFIPTIQAIGFPHLSSTLKPDP